MPQLTLSTIGISLFLGADRDLATKYSNEHDLPNDVQAQVDTYKQQIIQKLLAESIPQRRKSSAELNGIYGLYKDHISAAGNDVHYLITTDTVLGKKSAQIIKEVLEQEGVVNVQTLSPEKLDTSSTNNFAQGMQSLLKWCEETLPAYRKTGYRIVFNLTGGFKSLQGYLNIIGMFYADEIVYIFEQSSTLLRIPRLPIQVDASQIEQFAPQLAMMEQGHILKAEDLSALPEGILDIDEEEQTTLSAWGLLVWQRLKADVFVKKLFPFPRIVYEKSFQRDFEQLENSLKTKLQETLADIAGVLEANNGNTAELKRHGGIQYENYDNKQVDREPIGHFRLGSGPRVSCIAKNGNLYLRHVGLHDVVNNNP